MTKVVVYDPTLSTLVTPSDEPTYGEVLGQGLHEESEVVASELTNVVRQGRSRSRGLRPRGPNPMSQS